MTRSTLSADGMSLLGRLFGSRAPAGSSGGLERELRHLEAQAKDAPLGARGTLLNRAGDACLKAGNRERALRYFGEAIDALLADEQPEPARGVARKIIRIHPDAVRTLCTLAWLELAARRGTPAIRHLKDYVRAVKRAGREEMATGPILEMARTVRDPEFLEAAAEALEEIGVSTKADLVREWAAGGGHPQAPEDPRELSILCFQGATGSNAQRRAEGAMA